MKIGSGNALYRVRVEFGTQIAVAGRRREVSKLGQVFVGMTGQIERQSGGRWYTVGRVVSARSHTVESVGETGAVGRRVMRVDVLDVPGWHQGARR